jgi:prolyl 4-hydroxylase
MKITTNNIVFIILIVLSCVRLFLYYREFDPPEYIGRGFCDIDANYTKPTIHSNFVSQSEINHILNLANQDFRESTLVSGHSSEIRKSKTAWLCKNDPVISKIIQRVCDITNIPFENAEKMQVVKYDPNGYYKEHYDASCDDLKECVNFEKNGGQRLVTMIIYLNDDFTGGTTKFPNLKQEFVPKTGNGLLFYSLQNDGDKCHPLSLHAGMPVKTGHKYIANVWLRERKYTIPWSF